MRRLINDKTAARVKKLYKDGMKIVDIEETVGLARSTIYWLLDREGSTSRRTKKKVRLTADEQTVAHLYDLILEQEEMIQAQEAEIKSLRKRLPKK